MSWGNALISGPFRLLQWRHVWYLRLEKEIMSGTIWLWSYLAILFPIVLKPVWVLICSRCWVSISSPSCLPVCLSVCALATNLFLQVQKLLLHCFAAQPYNHPYFLILGKWSKDFELHRLKHKKLCFLSFFVSSGLLFSVCVFSFFVQYLVLLSPFLSSLSQTLWPMTIASVFSKYTSVSGVLANVCSLAVKFFSPRLRWASLLGVGFVEATFELAGLACCCCCCLAEG